MKTHKWKDVQKKMFTPEQIAESKAWVEREILVIGLRGLREKRGLTQEAVAQIVEMTQGELSRTERREDHLISTLRRVIEGMGGRLEVSAVFGKEKGKQEEPEERYRILEI